MGPSFQVQVAASLLTEEGLQRQPGVTVGCLIVEFWGDPRVSRPWCSRPWCGPNGPRPAATWRPGT